MKPHDADCIPKSEDYEFIIPEKYLPAIAMGLIDIEKFRVSEPNERRDALDMERIKKEVHDDACD